MVRLAVNPQPRERLATAREEERRRLRRDLHDGLGAALGGIVLQLGGAKTLLERDPAATAVLLDRLRDEVQDVIADIRRLVYELRPPQLDELGLVAALREHIDRLTRIGPGWPLDPDGLRVTVQAPEELSPLPAVVEVAAYRIAVEALTNVARHARARVCQMTLSCDGALELEIRDDGRGLPERQRRGVGLSSMRERAAELGGWCTIEPAASGGTVVRAHLPVQER
jgi:two-component system, NarL family, sensor kinase